ncbi:MAG: hypothetical protein ACRYG8_03220 [Janthinobacterium lividum]
MVNGAGALIEDASNDGIIVSGGAGTITDAGTIGSVRCQPGVYAIAFSGSFADRVILDPGVVLDGKVVGGTGTNTLELAAAPGSTGTVSAFGTEFQGFGTITLDKGASWLLDGAAPADKPFPSRGVTCCR